MYISFEVSIFPRELSSYETRRLKGIQENREVFNQLFPEVRKDDAYSVLNYITP